MNQGEKEQENKRGKEGKRKNKKGKIKRRKVRKLKKKSRKINKGVKRRTGKYERGKIEQDSKKGENQEQSEDKRQETD